MCRLRHSIYENDLYKKQKGKMMYIKVRLYYDECDHLSYYEYCIFAANHVVMGLSDWLYSDKAEAVETAKKLATDLKIEYREADHG